MNNFVWKFVDGNSIPLANKRVLFTPIQSPEITGSYLTTADSYQFTTSVNGDITSSIVSNFYKVDIAAPLPASSFYVSASENSSTIYSGSAGSSAVQIVFFDLINLVKDSSNIKRVTISPVQVCPSYIGKSILVNSAASSSVSGGYAEFQTVFPGTYQVDVYGKVDTTFYISVPTWGSFGETWSPEWNAKDLVVVKPPKANPIKLNCADNSYVLTVTSADARYVRAGGSGSIESASYSEYADTSATSTSASHADWADYATYAITAGSSIYAALATDANTASLAETASWAINAINGGTTLVTASLYPITSSWALNAANAGTTIVTGSTYPITASWALNGGTTITTASLYPITSSWASNSISASHALVADTALYIDAGDITTGTLSVARQAYPYLRSDTFIYNYAGAFYMSMLNNILTMSFSTATGSNAGFLSAADWTTFNNKQNKIATGSLLPVTASWADTASVVLNVIAQTPPTAALLSILSQAVGETTVQASPVTLTGDFINATASWAEGTDYSVYADAATVADYATNASASISASYLSGSNAVVGTLTVTGQLNATQISGSQVYITSSQLIVVDNILTLNAQSPYLRYAGIEMYDSGSDNLASLLWDGEGNYFFLSSSDAGFSRKLITGPNGEGDLTPNRIVAVNDGVGIRDSIMSEVGGDTIIIDGTLSASSIVGNLTGTASWATNAINGGTTLVTASLYPITSSWALNAINAQTASYISKSITFPTVLNGYFAVYENYTLATSSFLSQSTSNIVALAPIVGTLSGTSSNSTSASHANVVDYIDVTNNNVVVGVSAGANTNPTNTLRTQIGYAAGNNSATASNATQIGYNAGGGSTNAIQAVQIGDSAGSGTTAATQAVQIGAGAGQNSKTATQAVQIGHLAGQNSTTASNCVQIGYGAGANSTFAIETVEIGHLAGLSVATASAAVIIGAFAGYISKDATNATIIGSNTEGSASSIVIGHLATASAANQMVLGGEEITSTIIRGNIAAPNGITASLLGTASALPKPVLRSDTFTYNYPEAVSVLMTNSILTMSFSTATGSNAGFLSSTDWNKFNNKQNALGTGSTYPFTASWANYAISASYAPGNPSVSSSYSNTSSHALYSPTASYLIPNTGSNNLYLLCDNGSIYKVSLKNDGGKITLAIDQSPTTTTASFFVNVGSYPNTVNTITTVTSNYSASTSDYTIVCKNTTPISIYLTSSLPAGTMYNIKNGSSGSFPVTVIPSSGTIDGSSNAIINSAYTSMQVHYDGTNWWIV
jgi:hypothetical protein